MRRMTPKSWHSCGRSREPKSARREEAKPIDRQKRQRQLNKKTRTHIKSMRSFFVEIWKFVETIDIVRKTM